MFCCFACAETQKKESLVLWYKRTFENWNEALPIGNGRAGAMVFGGVDKEQLQLNENTLYSGEPSTVFKDIKITPEMFDKVVGLMKAQKYDEASTLSANIGWGVCTSIISLLAICLSRTTSREKCPVINVN